MTPEAIEAEQALLDEMQASLSESVPTSYRRAIAATFQDARGTLEIKPLWTCRGESFFRVNWWTGVDLHRPQIANSAFVAVSETDGVPVVKVRTSRRAA